MQKKYLAQFFVFLVLPGRGSGYISVVGFLLLFFAPIVELRIRGIRTHVLVGIGLPEKLVEKMFRPDNAMDRLRGGVANRTTYEYKPVKIFFEIRLFRKKGKEVSKEKLCQS